MGDFMNRRKRTQGDATYIAAMISLFMLLTLAYISLLLLCNLMKLSDVDRISRKYILRMERVGYLSASDADSLKTELEKMGAINISTAGSSIEPVGYGNPVRLVLQCQVPVYHVKADENGDFKSENGIYNTYHRTTTGTAMY